MNLTKHWAAQLDDYVIDLAWSPDGTQLAAASAAGPIQLYARANGQLAHTLPGHTDGTNCLAWQPNGTALASGGQDNSVKFWDPTTGQHTATAKIGTAWVESISWRPAATTKPLLAASAGRTLALLHPDASLAHTFKLAPKSINAIAWHPQGGALASAYFGGVCLWDADDFHAQKEFPYSNGIATLAWSPDTRWLVSGNQDPSVHLWLPEEDQEFHMSGYESKVKDLSFDHTSHWLATSGGQDACIWDCTGAGPEGREPAMLPHDAKISALSFQNTHGLLATAAQDGTVQLWSPERKQPLRATIKMPSAATKLRWSPDDQHLAIGSEKGIVYVLTCET
jgi:WD40 repeat protein